MSVAVLVAPLFEDSELLVPYYRLQEEGHEVVLVGAEAETTYRGKHGVPAVSDVAAADVKPADIDAVVIPGGYSPDHMRRSPEMVALVREVGMAGRPVAAICHGPWMLASAGLLEGRKLTSFSSIRDDLENAGGAWVDEEVVVDSNLITSRSPDDLPAFCRELVAALRR